MGNEMVNFESIGKFNFVIDLFCGFRKLKVFKFGFYDWCYYLIQVFFLCIMKYFLNSKKKFNKLFLNNIKFVSIQYKVF